MGLKYFKQLPDCKQKVIDEALKEVDNKSIPLDEVLTRLQRALHIEQFPLHKYIADREHALLPDDVNRWISFLAALGIKFPENIECIE